MVTNGHRVLIPLDGSRASEEVLKPLLPLVQAHESEVTLLYISEGGERPFSSHAYLQGLQETLRSRGIKATARFASGHPARRITNYAHAHDIDLIALARPVQNWWRAIKGGVSDRILAGTSVPVLVHRPGCEIRPFSRIVVALNGNAESEVILSDAASLARKLNATVDVIRVGTVFLNLGKMGYVLDSQSFVQPAEYVRTICERLSSESVSARPVSLPGVPGPEIIRHAEKTGAGLILLASHYRTGLTSMVTGSVTRDVINGAPCPVFIRPSRAAVGKRVA